MTPQHRPWAGRLVGAALFAGLATTASAQTLTKGQQFYQKVCAKCHEVGTGPLLLGRQLPEATVQIIARHGLNAMPAFRHTDIDDATLLELATYIHQSAAPANK